MQHGEAPTGRTGPFSGLAPFHPQTDNSLWILLCGRLARPFRARRTALSSAPVNSIFFSLLAAGLLLTPAASAQPPDPPSFHPEDRQDLANRYRETAGQILGAALTDRDAWAKLEHLTLRIGHRLSGSAGLSDAIEWAAETMRAEGLDRVHLQEVLVPHWVRGPARATLLSPSTDQLPILALGGSVATPPGGIRAPAVIARSFEELDRMPRSEVEGRIVVWAVPWMGYGGTGAYRRMGAVRAAAKGAAASLVRSATGRSLSTPHTGNMRYEAGTPKIPAAALTVEDAERLRRLDELGEPIEIHLELEAETLPDARSHNVMAEITGSELPEEVVVMGGHYDSWDVGHGAHDDGAACIAAWHGLTLLRRLELRPRRTLRVVLWTNEENGGRGGTAYRDFVGDGIENHVAAIEMDGGAERPVGFGIGLPWLGDGPDADDGYAEALAILRPIGSLFSAIDAEAMTRGGGGADIRPLMADGVPGIGFRTVSEHYFDWHHTEADTLDKVDPDDLRRAAGMLAVLGYLLADMPDRLPHGSTRGQ